MPKPRVKICGVQTPELARMAAIAGADYIGMVFHPQSRRSVCVEQAVLISAAAVAEGAIPVAVFVNHTAREMLEICGFARIQVVQLHGDVARKNHHALPAHFQRMYVLPVEPSGIVVVDSKMSNCELKRDYILFDNAEPGKGQPFDWDAFHYPGPFRMGFAGGLTPHNVRHVIDKFQPAFVDVSGGVENALGEKDVQLIQQFCNRSQT